MSEELHNDKELEKEYDEAFDGDEKVSHALKIQKSNFVIKLGEVELKDLSFTEPIKKGRVDTYLGLSKSIQEMGILSPIHVMVTEGYADWLSGDQSEEFIGYKFLVIDGFRRLYGGLKNGLTKVNAVIWEFEDKDLGSRLITALSRLLNKAQEHSWSEIWYLYQVLELDSNMSPGTLEYLLGLDSGDAMKLKDIMLSGYDDIKSDLLSKKKTITQCYNALLKLRKEEDKIQRDDNMGISDIEEADSITNSTSGYSDGDEDGDNTSARGTLSDDDVKELLDMVDDYDSSSELSDEDFDELANTDEPAEMQKVGERHPLDPALKAETMVRDGYKCVCCGEGAGYPMKYAMSILQSHHLISVKNQGRDEKDNLITICMTCHTIIHLLVRNAMKLSMSKDEFDALPSEEQLKWKNRLKYARVDYEAGKRLGKSSKDMANDNKDYYKFKMPGTDLKENSKAMDLYNAQGGSSSEVSGDVDTSVNEDALGEGTEE